MKKKGFLKYFTGGFLFGSFGYVVGRKLNERNIPNRNIKKEKKNYSEFLKNEYITELNLKYTILNNSYKTVDDIYRLTFIEHKKILIDNTFIKDFTQYLQIIFKDTLYTIIRKDDNEWFKRLLNIIVAYKLCNPTIICIFKQKLIDTIRDFTYDKINNARNRIYRVNESEKIKDICKFINLFKNITDKDILDNNTVNKLIKNLKQILPEYIDFSIYNC